MNIINKYNGAFEKTIDIPDEVMQLNQFGQFLIILTKSIEVIEWNIIKNS